MGGLGDPRATAVQAAVVTAMARDEEFAATYRREFLGPKVAASRAIFERARDRGEIRDDVDLDLLAPPCRASCSTASSCWATRPPPTWWPG